MQHTTKIYVLLLNEGTECWRPVNAKERDGLRILDFPISYIGDRPETVEDCRMNLVICRNF
jgi:hypothetical protein